MTLQQRLQHLLPPRVQLTRYSRIPRQSPSSSFSSSPSSSRVKSTPLQTRTFRTTPRRLTTQPPPPSKTPSISTTSTSTAATTTRLDRILSRLPSPLKRYTSRLRSAPVSHVVAFLILHELTAIIPLLGLFGFFHYYIPSSSSSWIDYILTNYGTYVQDGVTKFERYFTRKGWFGFGLGEEQDQDQVQQQETEMKIEGKSQEQGQDKTKTRTAMQRWESGDGKYRILVEIALAYALTKVLLPVRIVASVSATPWFAGVLARVRNIVGTGRRKP